MRPESKKWNRSDLIACGAFFAAIIAGVGVRYCQMREKPMQPVERSFSGPGSYEEIKRLGEEPLPENERAPRISVEDLSVSAIHDPCMGVEGAQEGDTCVVPGGGDTSVAGEDLRQVFE